MSLTVTVVPSPELKVKAEKAYQAHQRSKRRLQKALRDLRDACLHEKVAACNDQSARGIRVCTECGLEDHGSWGTYQILKPESITQLASIDLVRNACPLPSEIYGYCRGTAEHPSHAVPRLEMAGETGLCHKHLIGKVCDSCGGARSKWVSYWDGTGEGKWYDCSKCNKAGVLPEETS